MQTRRLAGISFITIALCAIGFLIGFPRLPKPGVVKTKSSRAEIASQDALIRARRKVFVDPILQAIHSDDLASARSKWSLFVESNSYMEDPMLRLQLARYFLRKGAVAEANEQADKILHPPKGTFSTLQRSGEVMSIWMDTSHGMSQAAKDSIQANWENSTSE